MTSLVLIVCVVIFLYIQEKMEKNKKITPFKDTEDIAKQISARTTELLKASEDFFAQKGLDEEKIKLKELKESEANLKELLKEFDLDDFSFDLLVPNVDSRPEEKIKIYKKNSTVKNTSPNIEQAKINYIEKLKSMKLPTFEKIRRCCSNLVDENAADTLHMDIAKNSKMHKARLYSAFDKLFNQINSKLINIIDYNCGQGLGTSILLDYIREKQLDIEISSITLIDIDSKALDRASLHVDVLKNGNIPIKTVQKKLNNLNTYDLSFNNRHTILQLFSNIFYDDMLNIDNKFLSMMPFENTYFICVSPKKNDLRIDKIYYHFYSILISDRNNKIGRYERSEKIFKADGYSININDNDIPF